MATIPQVLVLEHLDNLSRATALNELAHTHKIVPYRSRNERPNLECIQLFLNYAKIAEFNPTPAARPWVPVGNIGPLLIVGHYLEDWNYGVPLPDYPTLTPQAVARVVVGKPQYEKALFALNQAAGGSGLDALPVPEDTPFHQVEFPAPYSLSEKDALAFILRHFPLHAHDREGVERFVRQAGNAPVPRSGSIPEGFREFAVFLARGGVPVVDLRDCLLTKESADLVPEGLDARHNVLVFGQTGASLFVATSDLDSFAFNDELQNKTSPEARRDVINALCSEARIIQAIQEQRGGGAAARAAEALESDESSNSNAEIIVDPDQARLTDPREANITPKQLYHCILYNAIEDGASDIHFEYYNENGRVRFRCGGSLKEFARPPMDVYIGVLAILKNDAGLKPSNFEGSDGRTSIRCGEKLCDARVAAIPYRRNLLKVTVRLLDKGRSFRRLPDLDLSPARFTMVERVLQQRQGMVLVTGPTGSGKSTTIYAMLSHINKPAINIQTVENPIEYELDGMNQTQINPERGLTMEKVLPMLMRQDPDVIFIGEVRDLGTAKICVESAQTGHLVFSTLHANSCVATVARFTSLGVEPVLLGANLSLVTAQRLVQRVCESCSQRMPFTATMLEELKTCGFLPTSDFYRTGIGCERCRGSGYRGQIPVMEFLPVDEDFQGLISANSPEKVLHAACVERKLPTLYEEGLNRAMSGVTDFEEILSLASAWEPVVRQPKKT